MRPILFVPLLLLVALVSCGDQEQKGPGEVPRVDRSAPVTDTSSDYVPPLDTTGKADPNLRADTLDGRLQLTVDGGVSGRWTFYDVTASIDERAGGGTTTEILQYEAHRVGPDAHFKFRLYGGDAGLAPGTWRISDDPGAPRIEVSFDTGNDFWRTIGGGSGQVRLEKLDTRAVGSFDLTVPAVEPGKEAVHLTGSFDQEVRR